MRPKTIEACSRAIRRLGEHFDHRIDDLGPDELSGYFDELLDSHSWSSVKHDLYGYRFYVEHVLGRPWTMTSLIKPPKVRRLPDIVTVEEAQRLFAATRSLSLRVFFFTLYSLGLRLGERLSLGVADIDAARMRVHIRDAKGHRDRFVPLPGSTRLGGTATSTCEFLPPLSCRPVSHLGRKKLATCLRETPVQSPRADAESRRREQTPMYCVSVLVVRWRESGCSLYHCCTGFASVGRSFARRCCYCRCCLRCSCQSNQMRPAIHFN